MIESTFKFIGLPQTQVQNSKGDRFYITFKFAGKEGRTFQANSPVPVQDKFFDRVCEIVMTGAVPVTGKSEKGAYAYFRVDTVDCKPVKEG